MNYAEQIKYAIKKSHKTAKEVAAICDISEASVYAAIKKKGAFISQENLSKISDGLGIPVLYFMNYSIDAPTNQFDIYSRVLSLPSKGDDVLASIFDISLADLECDYHDAPNKFRIVTYPQIAYFSVDSECSWQFIYYGTNNPTPVDSKLYMQMKQIIKENIKWILNFNGIPEHETEEYYQRYDSDYSNFNKIKDKQFILDTENLTNEDLQMISQFADMLRKKNIQIK